MKYKALLLVAAMSLLMIGSVMALDAAYNLPPRKHYDYAVYKAANGKAASCKPASITYPPITYRYSPVTNSYSIINMISIGDGNVYSVWNTKAQAQADADKYNSALGYMNKRYPGQYCWFVKAVPDNIMLFRP